jgi:hypothetical protein
MMTMMEEQALIEKAAASARRLVEGLDRDRAELTAAGMADGQGLAAGAAAAAGRVLEQLQLSQGEENR